MTRFTDRVERDLNQIAEQASPSSTAAWASIEQRLAQPAHEPTMEVIMLAPDEKKPTRRRATNWLVAASVAAIALVGGLVLFDRGGDDDAAVTTSASEEPTRGGSEESVAPQPANPAPPLVRSGQATAVCEFGDFVETAGVSATAPQTCSYSSEPFPSDADEEISLTLFFNDSPSGGAGSNAFVSVGETGLLSAGYNYAENRSVHFIATRPGAGTYAGETVFVLGRSDDDVNAIFDWTIDADPVPLPTAEEGGVSADVTVECTPTVVETVDDTLVVDQACTFAGDDARFVPAPEVLRTTLRTVDGQPYEDQRPLFFTAQTDGDRVVAGFAPDYFSIRAVGIRPGTGEFAGMEIHDVIHFTSDRAFNLTGTMRSTVWPTG